MCVKRKLLQVLSRGGRAVDLCSDHRPYGNSKSSMAEVKRIQAAGGWVCNCKTRISPVQSACMKLQSSIPASHFLLKSSNWFNMCIQVSHGRVCGSLSVSRAFGDVPFKSQKKK
jgi:hypothetical protein